MAELSLRLAWPTEQVLEQPRLHRETLAQKNEKDLEGGLGRVVSGEMLQYRGKLAE